MVWLRIIQTGQLFFILRAAYRYSKLTYIDFFDGVKVESEAISGYCDCRHSRILYR